MRKCKLYSICIVAFLILATILSGCGISTNDSIGEAFQSNNQVADSLNTGANASESGDETIVSFIDVGQADCILAQSGGHSLLIDAGNNEDEETIKNYLMDQNIKALDYLILTHGHEDHIGSADTIVNEFLPKTIIMPSQDPVSVTKTYNDLLDAIAKNHMKITKPKVGDKYTFGDSNFTIIAPNSPKYEEANNYSVAVRLVYKNVSFLFMGDAEKQSEDEILEHALPIKSDVLKVGHHGSSSSTSREFLNVVDPSIAVISVGKDNDYGHPHKEVIDLLDKNKVKTYMTSLSGTIVIKTDGNSLGVSESKSVQSETEQSEEYYIGNKNSKVFHRPTCENLPSKHNRVILNSREQAISDGYKPCGNCKP